MGYYENLKCGNCKYSFTGGYTRTNGILKTYLGPPYAVCPQCDTVNKTGLKPWSCYALVEKIYHWFSVLIRSLFLGVFGSIMAYGLAQQLLSFDKDLNYFYDFIAVSSIVFVAYRVYVELSDITEVEQQHLAQTGD